MLYECKNVNPHAPSTTPASAVATESMRMKRNGHTSNIIIHEVEHILLSLHLYYQQLGKWPKSPLHSTRNNWLRNGINTTMYTGCAVLQDILFFTEMSQDKPSNFPLLLTWFVTRHSSTETAQWRE